MCASSVSQTWLGRLCFPLLPCRALSVADLVGARCLLPGGGRDGAGWKAASELVVVIVVFIRRAIFLSLVRRERTRRRERRLHGPCRVRTARAAAAASRTVAARALVVRRRGRRSRVADGSAGRLVAGRYHTVYLTRVGFPP